MHIDSKSIQSHGGAEKLQLVEMIWDALAAEVTAIPLPDWAIDEAIRRRDEMLTDPKLGLTDAEVWKRINDSRHG